MLQILDSANPKILYPLVLDKGAAYVTHKYEGYDTLTFDIHPKHDLYPLIAEEVRITNGENRFVVRDIDECATVSTVTCELDLDDWREKIYQSYRRTEMYLEEALEEIKPSGWTIVNAGINSSRKTIEASEGRPLENVTPYDLLGRISEVYDVVFNFDTINQTLIVVDPAIFEPSGEYIMADLNLKSLKYTGSTTQLVTRLYPYGKKDEDENYLTIASVNGGKEYVENYSYTDRIISAGWIDERYTDASSLKSAAEKKIKEMAYPVRSYQCEVSDLAKLHQEFKFLSFALYRVVTLVDKRRKTRINHQIVEYREYDGDEKENVVTLSSTVPQIKNTIDNIVSGIEEEASKNYSDMLAAIKHSTEVIVGAKGGNVVIKYTNNKPTEILIMDTDNMATAKRVWRWNIGGFGYSRNGVNGPFETAINMDGQIVASFITAGTMSANILKGGKLKSNNGRLEFDLDFARLRVYNTSGQLIMQLDTTGQKFYESGDYIGNIGTNKLKDSPNKKGLVFDLDNRGDYMAWAMKNESDDNTYTIKLSVCRENLGDVMSAGISIQDDVNFNYKKVSRCSSLLNCQSNVSQALAYNSSNNTAELIVNYGHSGAEFTRVIPFSTSDGRLKKNIAPSDIAALDELKRWKHRQFDWNSSGDHVACGYIAQELEEINPAHVIKVPQADGREFYQLDFRSIIPTLSKAVQELAERAEQQQKMIDALAQKCGISTLEPVAMSATAPEEVRQYEEEFDCTQIVETPAEPVVIVKEETDGTNH